MLKAMNVYITASLLLSVDCFEKYHQMDKAGPGGGLAALLFHWHA